MRFLSSQPTSIVPQFLELSVTVFVSYLNDNYPLLLSYGAQAENEVLSAVFTQLMPNVDELKLRNRFFCFSWIDFFVYKIYSLRNQKSRLQSKVSRAINY